MSTRNQICSLPSDKGKNRALLLDSIVGIFPFKNIGSRMFHVIDFNLPGDIISN